MPAKVHTTTEIQKRLIELGFLAPLNDSGLSNADGKFGTTSLGAYNRYRASHGKPPHEGMLLLSEISADVFPEDVPAPPPPKSNPITDYLTGLAIKAALSQLKKGLPMLSGYKTFATAIVLAVMGVYSLLFGDLPLVGHVDAGSAIMELLSALGLGFARIGSKADVAKAVDKGTL